MGFDGWRHSPLKDIPDEPAILTSKQANARRSVIHCYGNIRVEWITRGYPLRRHVPNVLSISRIAISIAVLILAARPTRITFTLSILLVIVAFVTDFVDGYLARLWNVASEVGYVLDALGDRAMSLSLTLVVLVRFNINPLIVWLLVFRDIGIYAVRVLTINWLAKSKEARWMSLVHATAVRTWLSMFLMRDGLRIYLRDDPLDIISFEVAQLAIITSSIAFAYYALAKSFNWIIDQEHAAL